MLMPYRQYSFSNVYKYGFNGKENDNEVKGVGEQQDYGMRIYDPRVGRFLSVDPLAAKYPWYTPYQFASNSPIANVDLDGGENLYFQIIHDQNTGKASIKKEIEHFPLEKIMPYNVYISIDHSDYFYEGSYALSFEGQRKMLDKALSDYSKNPRAAIQYLKDQKAAVESRNREDQEFWQNIWSESFTTAWAAGDYAKSPEAPMNEGTLPTTEKVPAIPMPSFSIQAEGEILAGQFTYANGHSIGILAEQSVVEKTLVLKDIVFYPLNVSGNELKNEFKEGAMLKTLQSLKDYAKSKGYTKLTIQYERAQKSSSKNPGHTVDKTFDLTNDNNGN